MAASKHGYRVITYRLSRRVKVPLSVTHPRIVSDSEGEFPCVQLCF